MPKLIDTDALYRATIDLFAERGYDALTTQEVATRAGINEVTIYRRYGTKAALVEAALTRVLADAPFAELTASDDVEADLVAMTRALEATTQVFGGAVVTLLTEAARHPELRDAMKPMMVNLRRAVGIVEAHQRHGRLVSGDPWHHLLLLLSPFVVGGLWTRTGVPAPARADVHGVVTAFLDGHRAG